MSLRRDLRWLGLFVVIPTLLTPRAGRHGALHRGGAAGAGAEVVLAGHPRVRGDHLLRGLHHRGGDGRRCHWRAAAPSGGRAPPTSPAGPSGCPTSERLEALTNRVLAFAFPLWTFAVVAGAIWAENAWGRYWGWDPKETWAFITWVVYAAYLHARSTAGWRGQPGVLDRDRRLGVVHDQLLRREHLRQRPALVRRGRRSGSDGSGSARRRRRCSIFFDPHVVVELLEEVRVVVRRQRPAPAAEPVTRGPARPDRGPARAGRRGCGTRIDDEQPDELGQRSGCRRAGCAGRR